MTILLEVWCILTKECGYGVKRPSEAVGAMRYKQLGFLWSHLDRYFWTLSHLSSASAGQIHLVLLPVVYLTMEPGTQLGCWFWAELQHQHGSQGKPKFEKNLIKSQVTLSCFSSECCHWERLLLIRLRSVINNGRLHNIKRLCSSCIGLTFEKSPNQ